MWNEFANSVVLIILARLSSTARDRLYSVHLMPDGAFFILAIISSDPAAVAAVPLVQATFSVTQHEDQYDYYNDKLSGSLKVLPSGSLKVLPSISLNCKFFDWNSISTHLKGYAGHNQLRSSCCGCCASGSSYFFCDSA